MESKIDKPKHFVVIEFKTKKDANRFYKNSHHVEGACACGLIRSCLDDFWAIFRQLKVGNK